MGELCRMKKGAVFIHNSRGPVVDLAEVLKEAI
jgi:phosphoglycerate dehydrogenase-like enzyme